MQKIYVALALDVEEEGLFTGKYQCNDPGIANIQHLSRLDNFIRHGIKPTLFCAYPVLTNPASKSVLQDYCACAEMGMHLHYWNTPPLGNDEKEFLTSVPAGKVPLELLNAKLQRLQEAASALCSAPVRSFRMGRWDIHRVMFPLLVKLGITCDASVRPLHYHLDKGNGPDHYLAPSDPYLVATTQGNILEVPLTVVQLLPALIKMYPPKLLWLARLNALALLAVYHPLWLLKLVTALHIQRGGKVLSLTWHSSEMMPGATPQLPDEASVEKFLAKMKNYFEWLEKKYSVQYVTMNELAHMGIFVSPAPGPGDWLGDIHAA